MSAHLSPTSRRMFDGLWSTISKLPPEQLRAIEADLRYTEARDKLSTYAPYPKQREFHAAGAKHSERLFMAANRVGKTLSGSAEVAIHLTGDYPDWWAGRRWERPIICWVAGETQETTRDTPQRQLLGPPAIPDEWGTAWLPADRIVKKPTMQGGTSDAVDTVLVRHVSGGISELAFKSYGKGRAKWQAAKLDLVWLDEECEMDVYMEALTRTNDSNGVMMMTFTPLRGVSDVVAMFLDQGE
jgi:phage terminase large subunit-like protein